MTLPPAAIRPAATILMVRDAPRFEVLMVKRHHQVDFVPGALVFPGGKTHAGDHDPAWSDHASGWAGLAPEERALRIAAIREAYEEAGVLMALRPDGGRFTGDSRADAARAAVAADQRPMLDLVRELGLVLDLTALTVFARWITPPVTAKRFDTWFYLAAPPPEQLAACDGHETVDVEWLEPSAALAMAASGERKIVFPTRMNLQLLAEARSRRHAFELARARPLAAVEPRLEHRSGGRVWTIPAAAGYGEVVEPVSADIG